MADLSSSASRHEDASSINWEGIISGLLTLIAGCIVNISSSHITPKNYNSVYFGIKKIHVAYHQGQRESIQYVAVLLVSGYVNFVSMSLIFQTKTGSMNFYLD